MIKNFLATLQELIKLTIEKLRNSIVSVLWDIIGKAIKISLPVPALPF